MLKVELTKNYAGVTIYGDYDDLNTLYDAIVYFIEEEPNNLTKYVMQNHVYGFLYDVRHAYQGDRESKLVNNNLSDVKRNWHNIKKKDIAKNNLYYSFNYLLPDLILDMILMRYFMKNIDNKNIYNPYINITNYFYSLVLHSFENLLTKVRFNKVKYEIMNSSISDKNFIPQWFELISIDYIKMNKKQREKEFMHIIDSICNYMNYKDYDDLKKEIDDNVKIKNCNIDNLYYEYDINEIEW